MLDPQAQALLQLMKDRGVAPVHTLTPTQARQYARDRRTYTQPPPPQLADVREHTITHGAVSFAARSYHPEKNPSHALPALLYLHGGGWTIGDLDTHDVLCRSLCEQAHGVVISLDYRMGPEHKFPAAYEDTIAGYDWCIQHAKQLGIDPHRIAVGGDSAGGNLTAAACLGLKGSAIEPCFQLLIYPAVTMRPDTPSYHANGQGYMLTQDSITYFTNNYLAKDADKDDWRASPIFASDHTHLPPAFVLTAGYDPLKDEGYMYADVLSKAQVATQYVCFERQIHGFITMGGILQEANTAVSLCAQTLKHAWKSKKIDTF